MVTYSERGASITFDTVLNAQDDLGISPGDDLTTSLTPGNHADTLIQLEPGTYYASQDMNTGNSLSNFGIESVTQDRSDVTIEINNESNQVELYNGQTGSGAPSGIYLGHVTLETLDSWGSHIIVTVSGFNGDCIFRDIEYLGWAGDGSGSASESSSGCKIATSNMQTSDAVGVWKTIRDERPVQFGTYKPDTNPAFFAGTGHTGTLWYEDLVIDETNESAIYTGKDSGDVHVRNSYFKNCSYAGVRLTGTGSDCTNCSFLIDTDDFQPESEITDPDGVTINYAIWTQTNTNNPRPGPTIDDCDIVVEKTGTNDSGNSVIGNHTNCGGMTLTNTRMEVNMPDTYNNPIFANQPSGDLQSAGHDTTVTIDNVSLTGSYTGGKPGIEIEDRDGSTISNSCIELPNADAGIRSEGVNQTPTHTIENSNINVGGTALVTDGANQNTSGLSFNEACADSPDLDSWNLTGGDDDGGSDDQSTYVTDFVGLSIGTELLPRWESASTDWSILSDHRNSLYGSDALELDPSAQSRHAISWDTVPETVDQEAVAVTRLPSQNSSYNSFARLILRGSTDAGDDEYGYVSSFQWGDTTDEYVPAIAKYVDGGFTVLAEGSPIDLVNTRWFRRFRANGSDLKLKYWKYGEDEPTSWDLEVTDTDITSAGWAGVGSFAPDPQEFDYLSVGTGGETATVPSTFDFRGHTFTSVVNAVTDLGMDNTGSTDVSEILHQDTSVGDLVVFPNGSYLNEGGYILGDLGGDAIGFVAKTAWDAYDGGDTRDPYEEDGVDYGDIYNSSVSFQPGPSSGEILSPRIGTNVELDLLVEGITLDHSNTSDGSGDSGTLGIGAGDVATERSDIRNIDHNGRAINYSSPGNESNAIRAGTTISTGTFVVHGCDLLEMHDRTLENSGNGRTAFYTGTGHSGILIYDECSCSEVGNGGFDASRTNWSPEGAVDIQDCYVENAGKAGYRISGGGSRIVNSDAVYDSSEYAGGDRAPSSGPSKPVVVENGNTDQGSMSPGASLTNMEITMRDCHLPGPAISAFHTARSLSIVDCTVDIQNVDLLNHDPQPEDGNQSNIGWIHRFGYNAWDSQPPGENPRQLEMDNTIVKVQNTSSSSKADAIVSAVDADVDDSIATTGTHIHNGTCLETVNTANDLHGVNIENWSADYSPFNATIENCTINVGGEEVNNVGGNSITTSGINTTSSCSIADEDDPDGLEGTLFYTDFSEYLNGDSLYSEWQSRWQSSDSNWFVESDFDFPDNTKLVHDSSTRNRQALTWDNVGTPDDVEIGIVAKTPSTWGGDSSTGSHIRPLIRGGENINGNGIGYFVAANENEWRLVSYNTDGSTSTLASWGTPTSDVLYRVRLRANATDIKAKAWQDGVSEPSSWDAEVTDSEHSSGWAGVSTFETSDEWAYVSIATEGESAYLPQTVISEDIGSDFDSFQSGIGVHHEQPSGSDWAGDGSVEKGYPSTDPDGDSLELYHHFNEDSGTTVNDVAAGNNATNNGATVNQPGLLGFTSYEFTRANTDYTQVDSSVDYGIANGGTNPFTIEGWAYFTGDTTVENGMFQNINTSNTTATNPPIGMIVEPPGELRFNIMDAGNTYHEAQDSEAFAENEWKYVAGVYEADGTMRLFKDKNGAMIEVATSSSPDIYDSGSQPEFGVWKRGQGYYFDGRLQDWRFFSRARSQTELQNAFDAYL